MTGEKTAVETPEWRLDLGATLLAGRNVFFRIWAPLATDLSVQIVLPDRMETVPLQPEGNGYFSGIVAGAGAGSRYFYLLGDGSARPDPASRFQPEGVHGPSLVVDPGAYSWKDGEWRGISLDKYVIYELHVGTFTAEGTFTAIIPELDYLLELGITAIELMPVVQFPGDRNWGYDGVYPFAPQNSYGSPDELKALIDACHGKGLAVIMDVVYNHLGPEGNYLGSFGKYFTERYRTPWGAAINYDGPFSDEVRHYFVSNALYWINEFHADALRLDAIHGIFDLTAKHVLLELTDAVREQGVSLGRHIPVIAESALNDVRTIAPPELGGHGADAQWNDDFHHSLRTVLTGEREGYYIDFGEFPQLVKAFREGFVYSGQYSPYRQRRHGSFSGHLPPRQFVVCSQNHDQVGNGSQSRRLGRILPMEKAKLSAATVLLSPYLPLLFMGEEYSDPAPFFYFTSFPDRELGEAVRKGRSEEALEICGDHTIADPQSEETFQACKLNRSLRHQPPHSHFFAFYRRLLELRRTAPGLQSLERDGVQVAGLEREKVIIVSRRADSDEAVCIFSFSDAAQDVELALGEGRWEKILDSAAKEWGGAGEAAPSTLTVEKEGTGITVAPFNVLLYQREKK